MSSDLADLRWPASDGDGGMDNIILDGIDTINRDVHGMASENKSILCQPIHLQRSDRIQMVHLRDTYRHRCRI